MPSSRQTDLIHGPTAGVLDKLKDLFGGGERRGRTKLYEDLPDGEIVERYARAQAYLNEHAWSGTPSETIDECWYLMDEWERRGNDPNVLDREAERVNERTDWEFEPDEYRLG